MKDAKKISKKMAEWADLIGIGSDALKNNINQNGVTVSILETKAEMDDAGVDYNYPYVLNNPYNIHMISAFEETLNTEEIEYYRINA